MLFKSVLLVAAVVAVAAQEEDNATGTDPFAAGFAAGYAAAQGSGEEEMGEGRLLAKTVAPPRAKKPKNNDVCYTVAATWWSTREAEKTRALVNNMDTDCQAWDQQPEFCNKKSARVGLTGYTQAQMDATCSTVGAHDHRCLGNPCNSLNTGDCSLQNSQGQCVWWWGKNFTDYNAHLVSQGLSPLPSHGCYRNPCNMPGYGKQQDACPLRSAPNLFTCTWCQGAGDAVLLGRGVGCQMTVPVTGAGCAPVNDNNVDQSTVMVAVANSRCQCTTNTALCKTIVDQSRSSFRPKNG